MTAVDPAPQRGLSLGAPVAIHHGDNLEVIQKLPDAAFTMIYLDPPFNTGRKRQHTTQRVTHAPDAVHIGNVADDPDGALFGEDFLHATENPVWNGFHGRKYERIRQTLTTFDDRFDDYWAFLEPRLSEAWRLLADDGTLYLHLDYREAHYAKVMLDAVFGRDHFLNEIIWAYDYGAKSKSRWPTKHDTILVYVKDPDRYHFDSDAIDREPYMAPGLVDADKAARGKLPTDVWWHTIVPTSGPERTGYPTQKPEGILARMIKASTRPGDRVLDFFAGSGTTGAVASRLGRQAVLVDGSPRAIEVMQARMPHAVVIR
ncbi:DNA-methyltransferase [Microbacterium excoecariae]|uniref:DNA-methyltransferase n=1 Tax=Microbacterium excoecariae TaxID=2715210 RepID=UPI003B8359D5